MRTEMNQKWILTDRPKPGPLDGTNFKFVEEPVQQLKDGEFLVKNSMLSFDPTQRFWMEMDTYIPKIPIGSVMQGAAVGEVVASKEPSFPVGTKVSGLFGWQKYAVCGGDASIFPPFKIPAHISEEAALSVFGMTGLTGYFGMLNVGKVKAGDTVLVSGASGATGSIAAQIAKIQGAKVIGTAGDDRKCAWLTDTAKIDAAINYKTQDIDTMLKKYAPNGINVYFDNVGGKTLDIALMHLAFYGRVVLCGAISTYDGVSDGAIKNYLHLVMKRASMQGFLIFDYVMQYGEATEKLAAWVNEGKIKFEVDVQQGLQNAPQTLQRLFAGKNLGKQLLKI